MPPSRRTTRGGARGWKKCSEHSRVTLETTAIMITTRRVVRIVRVAAVGDEQRMPMMSPDTTYNIQPNA